MFLSFIYMLSFAIRGKKKRTGISGDPQSFCATASYEIEMKSSSPTENKATPQVLCQHDFLS